MHALLRSLLDSCMHGSGVRWTHACTGQEFAGLLGGAHASLGQEFAGLMQAQVKSLLDSWVGLMLAQFRSSLDIGFTHTRVRSLLHSWVKLHTDFDMFFFSCYFWILFSLFSSYWGPEICLFVLHSRTLKTFVCVHVCARVHVCVCVCSAHACGCQRRTSGFVSQVISTLCLETESFVVW